jgi:hypothetical protein
MGDISLKGKGKAFLKMVKDLKKSSALHLKQSKYLEKNLKNLKK